MDELNTTNTALAELQQHIQPALDWTDPNKVIETQENRKNAEDLLIILRQARNSAEEKRLAITRPLDETKKRVLDLFRPHIARLDTMINVLSRRLSDHQLAQQRAAREAEQLILEQEAERMREARETGELVEHTVLTAEAIPQVATTHRANLGSVSYRELLDIRVVDHRLLPRDLMMPDMVKIRARVRSGADVPGVAIVKKMAPSTRAGR